MGNKKHATHRFWHSGECGSTLAPFKTINFMKSSIWDLTLIQGTFSFKCIFLQRHPWPLRVNFLRLQPKKIDDFERPQRAPTSGTMTLSETTCVAFLFPQGKMYYALCTTLQLCQSRARLWKSPISWKIMIFIDFHWFLSKIMKIDGFRCSWTSVASGIRPEIVFVAF